MSATDSPLAACPHLGMAEDPDTCLGYPSRFNLCYRSGSAPVIDLVYQREACLSPKYEHCPVFLQQGSGPFSGHRQVRRLPQVQRKMIWWALGLVLLLGLPFWLGRNSFSRAAWQTLGLAPSAPHTQGDPVNGGAVSSQASAVSQESAPEAAVTEAQELSTSSSPTAAHSPAPVNTAGPCGYGLEEPIPVEGYTLVLHHVDYGDTMNQLAEKYGTSIPAVQAINHFLPSPLWTEIVIVLPLNSEAVPGLPLLEPLALEGQPDSLQELSALSELGAQEFTRFNPFDETCASFQGYALIPKKEKHLP